MNGQAALFIARALAWALLLGGWIGLTQLAERHAAGAMAAYALIAGWLAALGLGATLGARLSAGAWRLRLLPLAAAALAAHGLLGTAQGGGLAALWLAMPGWALLVVLASGCVRGLRHALPQRPGPPLPAAACGALLAWAVVGAVVDSPALAPRLAGLAVAAAVLLALLQPARALPPPHAGCRAGLFDCALPAWPRDGWREVSRWPLLIAALVMLPMMAGLPQAAALCGVAPGGPLPGALLVALHLGAMFLPAWLLPATRWNAIACALLLALGGVLIGFGAPQAALAGMLAQAAAWSLAWRAQLADGALRAAPRSAPWRAALVQALLALALGAAVALAGPPALRAVHFGLGVAGALAGALALLRGSGVARLR